MGLHFRTGHIWITALLFVTLGASVTPVNRQAAAQASVETGLVGFWYGEIENLSGGDPRRVLAVEENGTCHWSISYKGKKVGFEKDKCKLDHQAGKVELVTSAKSQLSLTLVDKDHLRGVFGIEYHGGYTPHSLQMRRVQNPEARAAISAAIR